MTDPDPLLIAKRTLQMIGKFATPPTPEVYEVWCRLNEGADQDIHPELQIAVNEKESVSAELLQASSDEQLKACVSSLSSETVEIEAKFKHFSRKLSDSQEQVEALQQDLMVSQKGMMTDHSIHCFSSF